MERMRLGSGSGDKGRGGVGNGVGGMAEISRVWMVEMRGLERLRQQPGWRVGLSVNVGSTVGIGDYLRGCLSYFLPPLVEEGFSQGM
jgi:hypothetical protein